MKNLRKKISIGIISSVAILGGVLSQESMVYANSKSEKCLHEKHSMRKSSGVDFLEEYYAKRDSEILIENESRYNYKVLSSYKGELGLSNHNSHLKKYYDDVFEFIDCINSDNHSLEGFYYCVIGRNSFVIEFKK